MSKSITSMVISNVLTNHLNSDIISLIEPHLESDCQIVKNLYLLYRDKPISIESIEQHRFNVLNTTTRIEIRSTFFDSMPKPFIVWWYVIKFNIIVEIDGQTFTTRYNVQIGSDEPSSINGVYENISECLDLARKSSAYEYSSISSIGHATALRFMIHVANHRVLE